MTVYVQQVAEWLGTEPGSEFEIAQRVREGLPLGVQAVLLQHGLTREEFHRIVIPHRTFRHRTERLRKGLAEVLTADESDKALRAARVLALAEAVFGDRDKALRWMRKGKRRFAEATPMAMLETEAGARLVEQMLVQVDEGMFV